MFCAKLIPVSRIEFITAQSIFLSAIAFITVQSLFSLPCFYYCAEFSLRRTKITIAAARVIPPIISITRD